MNETDDAMLVDSTLIKMPLGKLICKAGNACLVSPASCA